MGELEISRRDRAVLVHGDTYLVELTRYVVLNPVRRGMVEQHGDWGRSSYLELPGYLPLQGAI